jgi:hypothetical protein
MNLHFGGQVFTWNFLLAAVLFPLLGADFLNKQQLWWIFISFV